MKVAMLNGSPRKNGNTSHALAAIRKGLLTAHPEAEIAEIRVYELNLKPCIACDRCQRNGGNCVLDDDTAATMDRIAAADLIIFGSPVYFAGIAGQLKILLDKFHSKGKLFTREKKRMGVVAVGGAALGDPAYDLISRQFRGIASYLGWPMVLDRAVSAMAEDDLAQDAASLAALEAAGAKM